jgi:tetraacyldisaccharide-1-P 4'-kinase
MRQDWQQLVAKLPPRPVLEASTQTTIAKVVRSGHTTDNRPDGSTTDDSVGRLKGKRCFAFSGLADNAGFIRAVTQTGAALAGTLDYADHYAYTATDLKRLSAAALDCGAELIVTTAKDFVRLDASYRWPLDLVSLDVDFEFHPDSDALVTIIQNRLRPSSQSLGGRQS